MTLQRQPDTREPPPGSAMLSANTTEYIYHSWHHPHSWESQHPGTIAMQVLALDAFIQGLLTSESIYLLTPTSPDNYWGLESWYGDLELPITLTEVDQSLDEYDHLHDDLNKGMLSDPGFKALFDSLPSPGVYFTHEFEGVPLPDDWMRKYVARNSILSLIHSSKLRVPFYASQMEAPVCILDQLETQKQAFGVRHPVPGLTMEILRQAWYRTASEANRLRRFNLYTVEMPFFLLSVLRQCADSRRDAIFRIVRQMRISDDVSNFRKWATDVDSERDPRKFIRAIRDLEDVASKLTGLTRDTTGSAKLTVGVSLAGPKAELSKEGLLESMLDKLPWQNRHLRFIKQLFNDVAEAGPLEHELTRVLDVEPEVAREAVGLINSMGRTGRG